MTPQKSAYWSEPNLQDNFANSEINTALLKRYIPKYVDSRPMTGFPYSMNFGDVVRIVTIKNYD